MNKSVRYLLTICLFWGSIFIMLPCFGQATITFGGGGDGFSWSDSNNWDSGTIPTVLDDVIINNSFVIINAAGQNAASVTLDGSDLIINGTGQTILDLVLENFSSVEIAASGQITETVTINNSRLDIISGDLTIDNDYICDGIVLLNDGALNISEGATLNIYNTDISSITVGIGTGFIDNEGTIIIDRTTAIPMGLNGAQGILVYEDAALELTNQATGIIKNLDTLFADFIYIDEFALTSSTIVNHGLIDISFPGIGLAAPTLPPFAPGFGITRPSFGFLFLNTTTIDNHGTIQIDSTQGEGIVFIEDSRLTNHSTGNIQMKLIDEVGIGMAGDATLINNGLIQMDSLAGRGFRIRGGASVTNKDTIKMQDIAGTSINLDHASTFTNDSVLIISQNTGDAVFQSEEGIDLDDGTTIFTNNGTITITGTEGSESMDIDGQFINNCLINVGIGYRNFSIRFSFWDTYRITSSTATTSSTSCCHPFTFRLGINDFGITYRKFRVNIFKESVLVFPID